MKTERTGTDMGRIAWLTKARLRAAIGATLCAVALTRCSSGTLTGTEQSCESSGGLLSTDRISCSGSASAAKGSPSLDIIDTGGDLSGSYRLQATLSVGQGTTKANVMAAEGEQTGGTLSPEQPLELDANISLDEDDDEVSVTLKTSGKEVRDLVYEATLVLVDYHLRLERKVRRWLERMRK